MPDSAAFADFQLYFGDIHNHCNLSYGAGSLADALHNARLQLDFASVTLHGHWDDMPQDDPRLGYLVDYHRQGFQRARAGWAGYLHATEAANRDGEFLTFPSFEWHSMQYGDHCILFRDIATPDIFHVAHVEELRQRLREHPHPSLLIPHHIGYLQGFRGINWAQTTAELSPVVEIMSFHGASEHSDADPAYLHAMGPRDRRSTAQYGLAQGHIFGFVGSSDHHSAHPGSYGYGQAAVWAKSLSRAAVWDALQNRRCYAITGDRIALAFSLNDQPMGSVIPFAQNRRIAVAVEGASALDYIEVLHKNRVIHRESPPVAAPDIRLPLKVRLEMGWGELETMTDWDVDLRIFAGELLDIEPHLRGHDIGIPVIDDVTPCVLSHLDYAGNRVRLRTQTPRNATVRSAATQAITLTLKAGENTFIQARINGLDSRLPISELLKGARSFYTSGFVSPSFVFHRALPADEYRHSFTITHEGEGKQRDWYYARVRQRNGQWAWASPIWVERA
ncbi:MAG: DUF3604 domain-containing protein [Chloroflexi bacterium]|nr:DUF3604 domain-containing protein [Chloroflexota bacterium]